jgi:hypothetical protein
VETAWIKKRDLLEVVWVIFAMKISESHAGQGLAGFVATKNLA